MAGGVNVLIANENDMVLGVGASENNVVQDLAWTWSPSTSRPAPWCGGVGFWPA
jgi:hypothetical protein